MLPNALLTLSSKGEIEMSKSIKHEKTKGRLSKIENERRERKRVRDMKADPLYNVFPFSPVNRLLFAQDF